MDEDGADVTGQFTVKKESGTLTIKRAKVVLQSQNLKKKYDGNVLENGTLPLAKEEGWADGEGATYTFKGKQKKVGVYLKENVFSYVLSANTKAENYDISTKFGDMTIEPLTGADKPTLRLNGTVNDIVYDGTEHTVETDRVDGRTEAGWTFPYGNHTITVEAVFTATGKDVKDYPAKLIQQPKAYDEDGEDITEQVNIQIEQVPTLRIVPKPLVLASQDLSKEYDGKALKNGEKPLGIEKGWIAGEGARYDFTSSQKEVGSTANAFDIVPNSGTKLENYALAKTEGTLTVTNRNAKYEITIKGNDGTFDYDGGEHTVSGFEDEDDKGRIVIHTDDDGTYYVTGLTSEKTVTDVDDSGEIPVNGTPVVKDEDGNDVSEQFAITPEKGTITVNKRKLTFTSKDMEKEYDGYPLYDGLKEVEIGGDGLCGDDEVAFTMTGSQTEVGTSENTFTYEFTDGKESNYDISSEYGTLEVTAKPAGDTTEPKGDDTTKVTVHYEDEDGDPVASDHEESYQKGTQVRVDSPKVSGFTPQYTYVQTDTEGLPDKEVEVTVTYVRNPDTDSEGRTIVKKQPEETQTEPSEDDHKSGSRRGGAIITVADSGASELKSADDVETPLMNLSFEGDHKCNVLRFLIMAAALAVVAAHTNRMKKYQEHIFTLRKKLEEERRTK